MSFTGRERERNGRETNFKGQRLYSPTPWLHGIFFENVRKRDSNRKSWRGSEKPIMTETVRKVHKSWLAVSLYLFHVSLAPIRSMYHPFRVSCCLVSPSFLTSRRPLNRWQFNWLRIQQQFGEMKTFGFRFPTKSAKLTFTWLQWVWDEGCGPKVILPYSSVHVMKG